MSAADFSDADFKDYIKRLLLQYQTYEDKLVEEQVANGGPPYEAHFSFARFYNWLFGLEQP